MNRFTFWWSHVLGAVPAGTYRIAGTDIRTTNLLTEGASDFRYGRLAVYRATFFHTLWGGPAGAGIEAYTTLRKTLSLDGEQSLLQKTSTSDRYNMDIIAFHGLSVAASDIGYPAYNRFEYTGIKDSTIPLMILGAGDPLYLNSMIVNDGPVALNAAENSIVLTIDYLKLGE